MYGLLFLKNQSFIYIRLIVCKDIICVCSICVHFTTGCLRWNRGKAMLVLITNYRQKCLAPKTKPFFFENVHNPTWDTLYSYYICTCRTFKNSTYLLLCNLLAIKYILLIFCVIFRNKLFSTY